MTGCQVQFLGQEEKFFSLICANLCESVKICGKHFLRVMGRCPIAPYVKFLIVKG